jgi:integrase
MQAMFSAPIYTGCVDDERNFAKPGPNRPRRSRFWVPLIALFCGLRQNEICQLATADVEDLDGITVIYVRKTHPWQKLKSKSARRYVPVHPELIRIGFLRYVSEIRSDQHVQLFPELKPDGRGYMSGIFQKRFNSFRRRVGIIDPDGVFHSLRHSWRDALREARITEEFAQILGGWKGVGQDKDYGSVGFSPKSRYQDLERVKFEGLDLSHLYA